MEVTIRRVRGNRFGVYLAGGRKPLITSSRETDLERLAEVLNRSPEQDWQIVIVQFRLGVLFETPQKLPTTREDCRDRLRKLRLYMREGAISVGDWLRECEQLHTQIEALKIARGRTERPLMYPEGEYTSIDDSIACQEIAQ